jgi:outer membrane receptor for ferrienterochelin and colicins
MAGWLAGILLTCQSAFSQLPDTVSLNEVVVTGEMKPILADRSLYQIKSISAREIRGRGATNLSELLSTELSFRISQDAALGSSLRLNGLSGEHIKILVDGVPMVGRQAGILDLSQINLFKVDHIEVVEGPMSVIYGSNALGGVINIISQRPVYGERNIYRTRTYYETAGVYNADADVIINRNKHTFGLSGGRHFFGGYSAPNDNFRYQTWKPKLQWNGNLDYALRTAKYNINIGSSFFTEELRNKNNPDDNPEKALDEYHYTARSLNKFDLSIPISDSLTTTLLFSYSYYQKIKNTKVKDLVTLEEFPYYNANSQDTTTFDNIMGRWTIGGKPGKKFDLQSGLEYNQENGSGKRIGGKQSLKEGAGFTSLKYSLLKRLNFQAGARYIYNSRFSAPLVYNFNALWDISPKASLRLAYGKGFRAPSLKELFFEFIDINHHVLGNDSLKAEESTYIGINADYTFNPQWSLSLNLFRNEIDNKIDLLYNSSDASKAQYFNLSGEKTYIEGAKLILNFNINNKLKLQAGSQLNGQSKISSGQYNWTTDASLNTSYFLQELKSRLSIYYKYNGKYFFYTANYNEYGALESVKENFLDKYHSLDFIVTKWLYKERMELSTGIKNIFDNKNILGRGSSGPHGGGDGPNNNPVGWGRTLFLQFQLNLNYDRKIPAA